MMMVAGLAALLGGVVVFGSNTSTANQLSESYACGGRRCARCHRFPYPAPGRTSRNSAPASAWKPAASKGQWRPLMPQEGYSATIKGAELTKQAGIASRWRDRGEAHFDRLRILAIAPGLFSEIRLDIPRAGGRSDVTVLPG